MKPDKGQWLSWKYENVVKCISISSGNIADEAARRKTEVGSRLINNSSLSWSKSCLLNRYQNCYWSTNHAYHARYKIMNSMDDSYSGASEHVRSSDYQLFLQSGTTHSMVYRPTTIRSCSMIMSLASQSAITMHGNTFSSGRWLCIKWLPLARLKL
jgi:hypothetical protein